MYSALREMDFNPELVVPEDEADALALLSAYVDSEIPVMVGLPASEGMGERASHVVTVIGHTYRRDPNEDLRVGNWAARYTRSLVVHDDARGPYQELMVNAPSDANEDIPTRLTLGDKPLEWCLMITPHRVNLGERDARLSCEHILAPFIELARRERIRDPWKPSEFKGLVRRMYLRRSDYFKRDLLPPSEDSRWKRKELTWRPAGLVARYWSLKLPRYVWVVELAQVESSWHDPFTHRIVGEILLDATSHWGAASDSLLSVHLNGLMAYRAADALGYPRQKAARETTPTGTKAMRHLSPAEKWDWLFYRDPEFKPYSPLIRVSD